MVISHSRRFVFIHIYKNAGTSITSALLPFATDRRPRRWIRWLGKLRGIDYSNAQPYPTHTKALRLVKLIGQGTFDSLFSFAIVRNPWDWQVSLYTYMLKTPTHFHHDIVKSLGSFENYIEWRCEPGRYELQKDFVCTKKGELLVDFVGRYENLDADFREICAHIGISASLPRLNVSRRKPYQEYYRSKATVELVRQTFAPDIALFGYCF